MKDPKTMSYKYFNYLFENNTIDSQIIIIKLAHNPLGRLQRLYVHLNIISNIEVNKTQHKNIIEKYSSDMCIVTTITYICIYNNWQQVLGIIK